VETDRVFRWFAGGLFLIMILFGAGMTMVILFGNEAIGLRMVNAFSAMFAGLLGLGSGYILGRTERQKQNGEEDTHDRT